MKKLLLIFTSLLVWQVYGQISTTYSGDFGIGELNDKITYMNNNEFAERDKLIEGSRYYEKEFTKSNVLLADGNWYNNVMLRYDAFEDVFEMQQNNQVFMLPKDKEINTVIMGADTIKSIKYKIGNKEDFQNFYQVVSGKLSLYILRSKAFVGAQAPRGFEDAKPAKFVDVRDEYFWSFNGTTDLQKVGNKKEIAAYLEGIDAFSYIKQEKISINKLEGLLKLVNHYNNSVK